MISIYTMKIYTTKASGVGKTLLSAFDNALFNTGVSNYNLIYLSSVIPPNSEIIPIQKYQAPGEDFGKRLYVVRACEDSDIPGQKIAAGIGWYQVPGLDGRGFFVEHHRTGADAPVLVENDIFDSLRDLCQTRGLEFDGANVRHVIESDTVIDAPKCVIALAVYQADNWG